jgi:hypothetical protein
MNGAGDYLEGFAVEFEVIAIDTESVRRLRLQRADCEEEAESQCRGDCYSGVFVFCFAWNGGAKVLEKWAVPEEVNSYTPSVLHSFCARFFV